MLSTQLKQNSRAWLYLRKYAFEHGRAYAFLHLAIAAFLVLWLGLYLNFSNPFLFSERNQVAYYFVTLFLSGCLSAGVLFSELGSKSKAIHYLLVPASTFEKFFATLLFGVFIFFVVASCIFYLIDSAAVAIANFKFDQHHEAINLLALNQYENPFFNGDITDIFYFYFPAQAIFLLCSIYFNKHGLFKAIVVTGLLWVMCIVLILILSQLIPPGIFKHSIGAYEVLEQSGDNKVIFVSPFLVTIILIFGKFLLAPLLWTAAFFRLKEKEI